MRRGNHLGCLSVSVEPFLFPLPILVIASSFVNRAPFVTGSVGVDGVLSVRSLTLMTLLGKGRRHRDHRLCNGSYVRGGNPPVAASFESFRNS